MGGGGAGPTGTGTAGPGAGEGVQGNDGGGENSGGGERGGEEGLIAAGVLAGLAGVAAGYLGYCAWVYRRQVRAYRRYLAVVQRYNPGVVEGVETNGGRLSLSSGGGQGANGGSRGSDGVAVGVGAGTGCGMSEKEKQRESQVVENGRAPRHRISTSTVDSLGWAMPAEPRFLFDDAHRPSMGSGGGSGSGSGVSPDTGPLPERSGGSVSGGSMSSTERLLDGQEPSFFSVVLRPRRALRVVNGLEGDSGGE